MARESRGSEWDPHTGQLLTLPDAASQLFWLSFNVTVSLLPSTCSVSLTPEPTVSASSLCASDLSDYFFLSPMATSPTEPLGTILKKKKVLKQINYSSPASDSPVPS